MFVQAWFAFAVLALATACSSVPGDRIIQNPTFAFDFSPPTGWTYFVKPAGTATGGLNDVTIAPGQVTSEADARRNVKNAVDAAIFQALQRLGYSAIGMKWTVDGYTPKNTPIPSQQLLAAQATAFQPLEYYIAGSGTVLQKHTATGNEDYIEKMSIRVTGSGMYSTSQWRALADQVFTILSINERVKFRSEVAIM